MPQLRRRPGHCVAGGAFSGLGSDARGIDQCESFLPVGSLDNHMPVLAKRKVRQRALVGIVVHDQNAVASDCVPAGWWRGRRVGQVTSAMRLDDKIEALVCAANLDRIP